MQYLHKFVKQNMRLQENVGPSDFSPLNPCPLPAVILGIEVPVLRIQFSGFESFTFKLLNTGVSICATVISVF